MKKMKFLMGGLLLVTAVTFSSQNALAESLTEEEIDQKLLEIGTPQEDLDMMSLEIKEDVLDFGAVEFLDGDSITDSLDEGEPEGVGTFGTIPSNEFSLNTVAYKGPNKSDGRSQFQVITKWDWHIGPFWKMTDPFGISWDSSKLRLQDNSTYYKHEWCPEYAFPRCSVVRNDDQNVVAYSESGGVGWNADLKSKVWEQNGYTSVILESKSTNPPKGSSQIHAGYYHTWGLGSVGLSFGGLSVTYTGSKSHDSRGTTVTFDL